MSRILYTIGGIAIGLAVMFCAVCAAHAETMTASITIVSAISTDDGGDAVPVPTDDGSINYDRPTR